MGNVVEQEPKKVVAMFATVAEGQTLGETIVRIEWENLSDRHPETQESPAAA